VLKIGRAKRADVEHALGAPDQGTQSTLDYALPRHAAHYYRFEFDPDRGVLVSHGYRRRQHAVPPDPTSDWRAYVQRLAGVGATRDEVREWLGEPESSWGWWPVETWEYRGDRHVDFKHGLVVGPG
jgi:hypothetical protein